LPLFEQPCPQGSDTAVFLHTNAADNLSAAFACFIDRLL
jgi:hypothetical protein